MRSNVVVILAAAMLASCGSDPGPGEPADPDAAAEPWQPEEVTTVAAGESFPNGIVSDGVTAWWVSTPTISSPLSSIRALDLASGEVRDLSGAFGAATFLRGDDDDLYVADENVRTIRAISKSTGAVRVVVTDNEGLLYFDLDAERIYWAAGVALRSVRKDGSDRRELATLSGAASLGLVVDDDRVYVLTVDGVEVVAKTGGTPALLLDLTVGASGNLAGDDNFVYVSDRTTPAAGRILKIPKAGPQGTSTQIASYQLNPGRMAGDGDWLYWVNRPSDSTGAVMRVALDGSVAEIVADGLEVPADVVLIPGAVLWTVNGREPSGGAIMAAPR